MPGNQPNTAPAIMNSLSARLLVLTALFVMLAEVLIFVPSAALYRVTYLERKVASAHLASLSLLAAPDNMVTAELREELLARVGARIVVLHGPNMRRLMLSEEMPPAVDAAFDLREQGPLTLIADAFETFMAGDDRVIRILSAVPDSPQAEIELVLDEAPLRAALLEYSTNIFWLSLVISLITAVLVYLSLDWLMVRPIRRLSETMIQFRRRPEDATTTIRASGRRDEIGVAEREFEVMQRRLRNALNQKAHLAALGAAVAKVNHDLRNILATVQLASDRLAASDDPGVRRLAPRMINAIDRAIALCEKTLKYGRADEEAPDMQRFELAPLVDEVGASLDGGLDDGIVWDNQVPPEITITADRDQLYRVLLNLGRNAVEASGSGGQVLITARDSGDEVEIDVADNGPGIPQQVREQLFEPFSGSGSSRGTGLGLAIAREIARSHGGDTELVRSDREGTVFRVRLRALDDVPPARRRAGE